VPRSARSLTRTSRGSAPLRAADQAQAPASILYQGNTPLHPGPSLEPDSTSLRGGPSRGVTTHGGHLPQATNLRDPVPPSRSGRRLPAAAEVEASAAARDARVFVGRRRQSSSGTAGVESGQARGQDLIRKLRVIGRLSRIDGEHPIRYTQSRLSCLCLDWPDMTMGRGGGGVHLRETTWSSGNSERSRNCKCFKARIPWSWLTLAKPRRTCSESARGVTSSRYLGDVPGECCSDHLGTQAELPMTTRRVAESRNLRREGRIHDAMVTAKHRIRLTFFRDALKSGLPDDTRC